MRIAIPVSDGHLEEHFGHCESFAFIDADAESKSILALHTVSAPEHEPGLLPRWLKEREVDVVIAGNMGGRAQTLLAGFSIQVLTGAPAWQADFLARAFLRGELESVPRTCNHSHEHAH
jgi:ATP-binding protein involved in chromosome partitioning